MNGAFYIGATGLQSQQRALDVVANNIANINTPGFKRSEVRFAELVSAPSNDDRGLAPSDSMNGMGGVAAMTSPRVFAQGEIKQTGKPLDIAINGEGFIELSGTNGTNLLWRGGGLIVSPDGYLAAANGMALKSTISVPLEATSLTISREGLVSAVVAGESGIKELGQLDIVRSKDLAGMVGMGDGLYQAGDPADLVTSLPGEEGAGVFQQGALESSNVQLSDEMVTLLLMQRAYAANAQVLQAGDQLMSIANGLRR